MRGVPRRQGNGPMSVSAEGRLPDGLNGECLRRALLAPRRKQTRRASRRWLSRRLRRQSGHGVRAAKAGMAFEPPWRARRSSRRHWARRASRRKASPFLAGRGFTGPEVSGRPGAERRLRLWAMNGLSQGKEPIFPCALAAWRGPGVWREWPGQHAVLAGAGPRSCRHEFHCQRGHRGPGCFRCRIPT